MRSLEFVSFTTDASNESLRHQLCAQGWSVRTRTGAEWIASPALRPPTMLRVLVPAAAETNGLDMERALVTRPAPTMAVLMDRLSAPGLALLAHCQDFAVWPCSEQELALRLERLAPASGATLPDESTRALKMEFEPMGLIGDSPVFVNALALVRKVARYEATVLIEGETGTGKELAARAIHYIGTRRDYPFIPVNAGAIPDNLVENELFGHERGAFTDASDAQIGLVAQAEGGTLFLDEVDALSAKAQVALLRFLQDQRYQPLGSRQMRQANVRVIAGSNANLDQRVATGDFRQDLLYRLRILSLCLPPLRSRRGDAVVLAEHFVKRYCAQYGCVPPTLHHSLRSWLETHDWPGNVRELENFIQRHLLLADDPCTLRAPQFGAGNASDPEGMEDFQEAKRQTIADFEREFLHRALARARGNVTVAARSAGKERRAFGRLLKKYGVKHARRGPSS